MCTDRQINLERLADGDQFYEIRKLTGEYFPFEIEEWDEALSMIRKLK